LTAFTEVRSVKFKKPVLIGDTVHVEVEIIEKVDARPEAAAAEVMKRTIINQRQEVVQEGEFILLIKKRR
jgi:acyl dehydratase